MNNDKVEITISRQAMQVVAAMLDENVPNERIFADPEVWQEVAKLFPPAMGVRRVFTGDLDDNFDVESYLRWEDHEEEV
jgi:hypothetical protein